MEHFKNLLFITLSVAVDNMANTLPVEDIVSLVTQIILILYTVIKLVQDKKFTDAILKLKDVIVLIFKLINILKKKNKNKQNEG